MNSLEMLSLFSLSQTEYGSPMTSFFATFFASDLLHDLGTKITPFTIILYPVLFLMYGCQHDHLI